MKPKIYKQLSDKFYYTPLYIPRQSFFKK